jgi:hypothetical protein
MRSAESSRAKIPDLWPIGTQAIVLCDDCFCLGLKYPDGLWRDKQDRVIQIDRIQTILKSTFKLDSNYDTTADFGLWTFD